MAYKMKVQRVFSFQWSESVAFYKDVLGFPLKYESEDIGWAEFDLGGVSLAIERQDPSDEESKGLVGRFVGVSIQVENIESVYNKLVSKEVEFIGKPEKQDWGGILAHFRDLDGNIITLLGE